MLQFTALVVFNEWNPSTVQAFIHPSLARIFWSSRSDPGPFVWSPYETCNGTFTATIDHRFTSIVNEDLGVEYVFFDFAGSGLVHVCGKMFYR